MQYIIRFVMLLCFGIPLMFFSAWVFATKLWTYFIWPVSPILFVKELTIGHALGFTVVLAWVNAGIVRLIVNRTADPEDGRTDEEKIKKAIEGYITSLLLTLVFWGLAELFHSFM